MTTLTPEKLAHWVTQQLEESKARDIRVLNVQGKTSITDFMIVCTGTSNRHVKSIAEKLVVEAKKQSIPLIGSSGEQTSEWVLVDIADVLVHVMLQETRDYYQLEALWQ